MKTTKKGLSRFRNFFEEKLRMDWIITSKGRRSGRKLQEQTPLCKSVFNIFSIGRIKQYRFVQKLPCVIKSLFVNIVFFNWV